MLSVAGYTKPPKAEVVKLHRKHKPTSGVLQETHFRFRGGRTQSCKEQLQKAAVAALTSAQMGVNTKPW